MAIRTETRDMTRREFTAASITALFVGMVVTMTACKSAGSGNAAVGPTPAPPAPSPQTGDAAGVISANHGHTAVVTRAQLQAGGGVSLSIRGEADHDHSLDMTADQVHQVAAGSKISSTSTVGTTQESDGYGGYSTYSHSHVVTFN